MQKFNELVEICENTIKLKKAMEKDSSLDYQSLLNDLLLKESECLNELFCDTKHVYKLGSFLEKEYDWYVELPFLLNFLNHKDMDPAFLRALLLVGKENNFYCAQTVSDLNREELSSLVYKPYFLELEQKIKLNEALSYLTLEAYLKEFEGKSLLDYGLSDIFFEEYKDASLDNSKSFSMAGDMEMLVGELLVLDCHEIDVDLYLHILETYFKVIPEKYFDDLVKDLLYQCFISRDILIEENYQAFWKLLEKYHLTCDSECEVPLSMDIHLSYSEIMMYDSFLQELMEVDREILRLYQEIVRDKVDGRAWELRKIDCQKLKLLIQKEQNIYDKIPDPKLLQDYMYEVFKIRTEYFPIKICDFIPDYTTYHFVEQEIQLLLHRIFHTLAGMPEEEDSLSFKDSLGNLMMDDEEEGFSFDLSPLVNVLTGGIVGDLTKEELLSYLESFGFDYDSFLTLQKQKYFEVAREAVCQNFCHSLQKLGYIDILSTYLFMHPDKMNEWLEFDLETFPVLKTPYCSQKLKYALYESVEYSFEQILDEPEFKDFDIEKEKDHFASLDFKYQLLLLYFDSYSILFSEEDSVSFREYSEDPSRKLR